MALERNVGAGSRSLKSLVDQLPILLPQVFKFVVVGFINTGCTLTVIALATICGLSPYAANALGYIVGVCCSYTLNRIWTFQSRRAHKATVPRFLLVFATSYLSNFLVLHFTLDALGPIGAQIAGAAIYVPVSFVGTRMAFRTPQPG